MAASNSPGLSKPKPQRLSEQEQIAVLNAAMKKNRWSVLLSDVLLGALLLVLVVVNPSTEVVSNTDVIILGIMFLMLIGAFLILLKSNVRCEVTHFRGVTALAGGCLLLLLASALFGNHGPLIHDGSVPWLAAYVGLLVAYFNAFRIRSEAIRLVGVFVLLTLSLVALSVALDPPRTMEAMAAVVWMAGALFMVPIHVTVLSEMQLKVHAEAVTALTRHETQAASTRKESRSPAQGTGFPGLDDLVGWLARQPACLVCLKLVPNDASADQGRVGRQLRDLVLLIARETGTLSPSSWYWDGYLVMGYPSASRADRESIRTGLQRVMRALSVQKRIRVEAQALINTDETVGAAGKAALSQLVITSLDKASTEQEGVYDQSSLVR